MSDIKDAAKAAIENAKDSVTHAAHNIEVPLEVLQEALKAVLLSGGRIRAVRPMASPEESDEAAAPAEAPPSAN